MNTSVMTDRPGLKEASDIFQQRISRVEHRIVICAGTGCVAGGALAVRDAFVRELTALGLEVATNLHADGALDSDKPISVYLSKSGCQGFCQMGPLVTLEPEGILYTRVTPEDVPEIVDVSLIKKSVVERLLYRHPQTGEQCKGKDTIPFYQRQERRVLKECGMLDPGDLYEYINHGGYEAARRALCDISDADICNEILQSGLRGRGGGGFPTGRKWDLTRIQPGDQKYVICNGDEGDPGAFMDRSVMEGNPHAVIEGMVIAAKAIGAQEGYIYVRMEYPLAIRRLQEAMDQAREFGALGENIFNSGFSFELHIMEGAGAFVCGEETALIASIEGKRGMPMPKPPFPAQSGLWGKPTLINNVETLASVPLILRYGPEQFRAQGTEKSPGTKTFALTGHVANTGLIEVPFGATLREIVYEIGGGVTDNAGNVTDRPFKAVQIGGPSGGCLVAEHLDLPLDFDSLGSVGAMVGSGGLVVMNDQTCMISVARFFMQFARNESCGKCVLCREGTRQMLALLDDIIAGEGTLETLEILEQTAEAVKIGSLCGLGKTAPNPVLSTLRYFRKEYEAHVIDKHCPAGVCPALCTPVIIDELCTGCGLCKRKCPVEAISGERKEVHHIDQEKCIKCGVCLESCRFDAIVQGAAQ
ncbi:MAG TPA: NADH-ubiquinone oxidoreductase-F iron-sulfur binding region domain-containing protein [Candidatus Hydrogenedentes bacterium]|nr:NADH-ubiquinone oxidoreductase-F iron-sulfur binding region domain-containing protein [Candidatus Hydrogenedentota bacterium]